MRVSQPRSRAKRTIANWSSSALTMSVSSVCWLVTKSPTFMRLTSAAAPSSHGDQAPPLASRGDLDAKGDEGEQGPAAVEKHSRGDDQAARDRADGGPLPKIGERGEGRRMDRELAVIRDRLDHEDPSVSAAQAPADRAGEADVVARRHVVLRQQLGPARIEPHAFAPEHGCVE